MAVPNNNAAYYNQGEAASLVGTATAADVLKGKTFTSSAGVGLTGTMENRGALNWNPTSNATLSVQPGYYSGGVLDSSGSYQAGYQAASTAAYGGSFAIYSKFTYKSGTLQPGSYSYYYYGTCSTSGWASVTFSVGATNYINIPDYAGFPDKSTAYYTTGTFDITQATNYTLNLSGADNGAGLFCLIKTR